jgi:hypothetical protein
MRIGAPTMTLDESRAWRPSLPGWSNDILPFYRELAGALEDGGEVVEVGVAAGRSIVFLASELVRLKKTKCKLWAVDPWPDDYFQGSGGEWNGFGRLLRKLVSHASDPELSLLHFLRLPSAEAAALWIADPTRKKPAAVFVDGDHSESAARLDLEIWRRACARGTQSTLPPRADKLEPYRTVMAGSDYRPPEWLLCGHDFNPPEWPGVVTAVNEAAALMGRTVRTFHSVWWIE